MFSKILIANRGEIACRVIRTARAMGIKTVTVYSDADKNALHVHQGDEGVYVGLSQASESYLRIDKIIDAALKTGAEAIHPGYGFLSENAEFVDAVEAAGLIFIGPSADAIRKMGLKDAAKRLMETAGVPVVPGYHGENQDPEFLAEQAETIGYPVLIKARAGGGGKGMRKVDKPADFKPLLESAQREGQASFGDAHVLIEKYITAPRHIEVQVFGDDHGNVVHLFERDCSLQRRHQKIIEEAPAPGMTQDIRAAMTNAAVKAVKAINYSGAGTIEFIVDGSGPLRADGFWFMEMNTRLQVEHPVTEAITGQDLVEWQLRVAFGETLPVEQQQLQINGHAFEARLYAEDATRDFLPAMGHISHLSFGHARIDTGVQSGSDISPHYDPMIAKLITHAKTRDEALRQLHNALEGTHVVGTVTNIGFLSALCSHNEFSSGNVDTGLIERDLPSLIAMESIPEQAILFAAISALGLNFDDPLLGWRLWDNASHQVTLVYDDAILEHTISLLPNRSIALNDTNTQLTEVRQSGTQTTAIFNGQVTRANVIAYEMQGIRHISVLLDGKTWVFAVPDPLLVDVSGTTTENVVVAPMTGVIKMINVVVGQSVKTDDILLITEAMKMELNLSAPRAGVVAEICCSAGDQAADGTVLVRFEEDTPETIEVT